MYARKLPITVCTGVGDVGAEIARCEQLKPRVSIKAAVVCCVAADL